MRAVALAIGLLVLVALGSTSVRGQDGDLVNLTLPKAEIGQQVALRLEVVTAKDATVEVDPAAPEWGKVAVVRIRSQVQRAEGENVRHVIVVIIAPFGRGTVFFQPVVNVVIGIDSVQRRMTEQQLDVIETLPADAALELSPLPPPGSISGVESPFLKPAIGLGIVTAVTLFAALTYLVVRWVARRPRKPAPADGPRPRPDLAGAGAILESDPVGAYRTLSAAVRRHLADTYGFPAVALTARELVRRMEAEGVDRWQARLVGGLLENCDAVVYAGYRPANERRQADLTMALEIVEAGA